MTSRLSDRVNQSYCNLHIKPAQKTMARQKISPLAALCVKISEGNKIEVKVQFNLFDNLLNEPGKPPTKTRFMSIYYRFHCFYTSRNTLGNYQDCVKILVEKMDDTNLQDKGKTTMFKISWHYNNEATPQKIQLSSYQKQFVRYKNYISCTFQV